MPRAARYHHDMAIFDTLRTTQRLREAGFEPAQAEALVAAFSDGVGDTVATKADVERLEERLEEQIDRLEERMDGKLDALEGRMKNYTLRIFGAGFGSLALLLAICTGLIMSAV